MKMIKKAIREIRKVGKRFESYGYTVDTPSGEIKNNILSPDDIFLKDGVRQKPIKKKRLEEWYNIDNIPLGSETRKHYERNKKLIDLTEIPDNIEKNIINTFKNYKVKDRSQLLNYFINNKLKSLIENINDF